MSAADAAFEFGPHSVESEQALLGAILINAAALDGVRHLVEASDFAEAVNGHLYEAMCLRRDAGEPIDIRLVKLTVGDRDLGGMTVGQYLAALAGGATTVINAPGYARSIRHAAQMRRVLETAQAAVGAMTGGEIADPGEYAAGMVDELDAVIVASHGRSVRRMRLGQSAAAVLDRVREAQSGRAQRGAPFGLPGLDRATLGMRDNQLLILAGRPGMGKTTAGIHFALSSARAGYGVGFVSLEMDDMELAERALAAVAYDRRDPISYRAIAQGVDIGESAYRRLDDARRALDRLPFEIEQQPGLTVSQIAARARSLRNRFERAGHYLGLLVIDHIGLIAPSKRYSGNRVQEMTEISGSLKRLAKELGIPILALSQLSRGVESRPDKRPVLSDLRDSGSIEQDADVVLGLFREAYYLEHVAEPTTEQFDRLNVVRDTLEIEILKQRSGPTIRVECFCDVSCNVLAEAARW
ncbi:replicative DNA helicase [Methylorubrum sp. SB2]|uniref:replicative DNA helicase n=1 Tax=Methylorubrum subtropicum TaxID=3138812 RepID=UPI00313E9925